MRAQVADPRPFEHERAALDQPAAQSEGQTGRLHRREVGNEHAAAIDR
jgi:hypothetical protein